MQRCPVCTTEIRQTPTRPVPVLLSRCALFRLELVYDGTLRRFIPKALYSPAVSDLIAADASRSRMIGPAEIEPRHEIGHPE